MDRGVRAAALRGGSPSLLRAINERSVLEVIRTLGPVARPRIAAETNLSKPTVSQVLNDLVGDGLVLQQGKSSGGRGPNALLYELDPKAGYVVGVDVGRQWLRAAIADISGALLARRTEPTSPSGGDALVAEIGEVVRLLGKEIGVSWGEVLHVTVGSPGVLDPNKRALAMAPNIPGWEREGLLTALADELGTEVVVENDVNLAALGEQALGHGGGVSNFVFFSVGTGVGMGLVLDGRLYTGSSGAAGEVGYLPVGEGIASGGRGAYEEASAADAIVEAARALGLAVSASKEVFDLARSGDRKAARVVAEEARRIAFGIASVVPVLDPELVIIGGGVGSNADLLLEPVERELRSISPFSPRIMASALGQDVVLRGALAAAVRAGQEALFSRRGTRIDQDRATRTEVVAGT